MEPQQANARTVSRTDQAAEPVNMVRNRHDKVLVPLWTWAYHSPALRRAGKVADLGLLAEALIYYDQVHIEVVEPAVLDALVAWAIERDSVRTLIRLIEEGVIVFEHHAFVAAAPRLMPTEEVEIWNVQTVDQQRPGSFARDVLYKTALPSISSAARTRLYRAIEQHCIEEHADDYEPAVEDAREAIRDPNRLAHLVQTFLDDMYTEGVLDRRPTASCVQVPDVVGKRSYIWTSGMDEAVRAAGSHMTFDATTPLQGEAESNKVIWTGMRRGLDLYLGDVLSTLTGNRLTAIGATIGKPEEIIQTLEAEVEFPDLRAAVNSGQLGLDTVLSVRAHSGKFRDWLQETSERDIDQIVAYHNEVRRASGLKVGATRTIKAFGVIAPIASLALTKEQAAVVNAGTRFLTLAAEHLSKEWKPVVFGNWMREHIEQGRK